MMHAQPGLSKAVCTGATPLQALRMGNKPDIPEPPPHVPEKFKQAWASLPGCCRSFYMNPGSGCCAGMPEPKPSIMDAPKAAAPKAGETNATHKAGTEKTATEKIKKAASPDKKGLLWAVQDWFKYLLTGFLKDMKRILTGAKTD